MANEAKGVEKPRYERGSVKMKLTDGLEATLLLDLSRYSSGSMLMRMADTDLRLKEGDREVGSIGMALGGTLYVSIKDGDHSRDWAIDPIRIFEMVVEAEKEQYLAPETK